MDSFFNDDMDALPRPDTDRVSTTSPEWSDYVMSSFTSDELVTVDGKDYPNVAGLRRVAELLIGDIAASRPVNVWPFDDKRATVQYEVVFMNGLTYGDVADVSGDNIDQFFFRFAVTTACTRAEARCLRKALKLRTCAAEEIPRGNVELPAVKPETETNLNITTSQITFFENKFKALDIDGKAFVNMGKKKYKELGDVSFDTAKEMVKQIGVYANGSVEIPASIRGYKTNWRD